MDKTVAIKNELLCYLINSLTDIVHEYIDGIIGDIVFDFKKHNNDILNNCGGEMFMCVCNGKIYVLIGKIYSQYMYIFDADTKKYLCKWDYNLCIVPDKMIGNNERNEIYIMGNVNGCIYVFDSTNGKRLEKIGGKKSVYEKITFSKNMVLSDDNKELYITNTQNRCVNVFNTIEKKFLRKIKNDKNNFFCPCGLAIHDDKLYVSDIHNKCMCVMNSVTGDYIKNFGKGYFEKPTSVLIHNKKLYIIDTGFEHDRVCVFNLDGDLLNEWRLGNKIKRDIMDEIYLAKNSYDMVAYNNELYITDPIKNNIYIYS